MFGGEINEVNFNFFDLETFIIMFAVAFTLYGLSLFSKKANYKVIFKQIAIFTAVSYVIIILLRILFG